MLSEKWKQRIASSHLLTTGDGRIVFYPFGPLKGYLLPKSAYRPLVVKMFESFTIFTIATLVFSFLIGGIFKLSLELLLLIGLLDLIPYCFCVRRLTRKMIKLPCKLSMQVYASVQDPEEMKVLFWRKLFLVIICAFFTVVGSQSALGCFFVAFISVSLLINSYLIYLQAHELNANLQETT